MSVAKAIMALVDGANVNVDFRVIPSGNMTDYTVEWLNDSLTEPTSSAIETKRNEIYAAEKLDEVREERNRKLAETDWTQNRDVTLSNDADWKTYRQALRDITDDATSLDDVTWPEKP
jgi:hypothetical protein